MGRPLFSSTYDAPAVRVEPEQTQPAYEKWSYWNPFDPDSEEFFADAEDERVRPLEQEDVRGASALVEDVSSGSSDGTSSGRETPLFADSNLSVEELNLQERRRRALEQADLDGFTDGETRTPLPDDGQTYRAVHSRVGYTTFSPPRAATSYVRTPYRAEQLSRSPSPTRVPHTEVAIEPMSVSRPAPTRSAPIAIPARPSTPPNQIANSYGTPSPAPSVTPRLYTWRAPALPVASPGSPLPNRGARMSVAHISPSAVSVQRVLG